jgi:hypothetical protein
MKKVILMKRVILVVLMVMFLASFGWAYTINDHPNDAIEASPGIYESLGIDINVVNGFMTFDLFTAFDGYNRVGSWDTYGADLALDFNRDGWFEAAFGLDNHSPTYGHLMTGVTSWLSSTDRKNQDGGASGNYNYGNSQWITAENFTDSVFYGVEHDTIGYHFEFLTPVDYNGEDIQIHWGTATCANDIVQGDANVPVPEPATMLLLGSGLIGLAGIGRKKMKRS